MIVKQTFLNHIRVLQNAIFTTVLYFGVCWYFKFEKAAIIMGLCYYSFTVLPSFFLHVRYYFRNRGMACHILPGKLCISKNGKEQIIERTDIEEIVVYKSASLEEGGIPITAMEAYFFVRIFDKSENRYDLTCLLDTNIDKKIKNMGAVSTFVERGMFNNL